MGKKLRLAANLFHSLIFFLEVIATGDQLKGDHHYLNNKIIIIIIPRLEQCRYRLGSSKYTTQHIKQRPR